MMNRNFFNFISKLNKYFVVFINWSGGGARWYVNMKEADALLTTRLEHVCCHFYLIKIFILILIIYPVLF